MADYLDRGLRKIGVALSKTTLSVICIVAGAMVILFPDLLVWIVGLFLVVEGALILAGEFEQVRVREQERQMIGTPLLNNVHCKNCGAVNAEESLYCSKCGKELAQTEMIVTDRMEEIAQQTELKG